MSISSTRPERETDRVASINNKALMREVERYQKMRRPKGNIFLQMACVVVVWAIIMGAIVAPFVWTRRSPQSKSWETLLKSRNTQMHVDPKYTLLRGKKITPIGVPASSRSSPMVAKEINDKIKAWLAERGDSTGVGKKPEFDLFFFHLKDNQTVRAGDTLALDFRCTGLGGFSVLAWKQLSFAILVNGTAWDEKKLIINADVANGRSSVTFILDLPLGQHRLQLEFWAKGGPTGLKSKVHNVTSRRPDTDEPWVEAKGEDSCMVSLMCRSLLEFDNILRKEQYTYFLTYYTLMGMHLWGWFPPWRGVHRYDSGVQGNYAKFMNHKTPYKNIIYTGMFYHEYDAALNEALKRTKRWTVETLGTPSTGVILTYTHTSLANVKVVMYLFQRKTEIKQISGGKGQEERKISWHASSVDLEMGRIFHEDFGLRDFELFERVFRVPDDTDLYLKNEFGLGWELLAANLIFKSTVPDTALEVPRVDEAEWKQKYPMCGEIPTTRSRSEKKIVNNRVAFNSLKDKWKVALCTKDYDETKHPSPGSGLIVIRRLEGCQADWRGFLSENDRTIAQEAHDIYGPDELFVDMEGPEMHSLTQRHLGQCRYAFEYDTRIPGMYFLKIMHLRERYSALTEENHWYQRPSFDDLLGEPVPILLGLSQEARATALAAPRDAALLTAIHQPPIGDDPVCDTSSGATAQGRWVMLPPTPINKRVFEIKPSIYCPKCEVRKPEYRACGSGRVWLTDPKTYGFVPYDCKYKAVEGANRASCLSGKKIMFSGDSHMRTFFNAFMNQACGVSFEAQKGYSISQCHSPNATSPCAGSLICLEHNYLGWVDATLNPNLWDVFIANFGQHPASGAFQWTQREFRRWFDTYMQVVLLRLEAEVKEDGPKLGNHSGEPDKTSKAELSRDMQTIWAGKKSQGAGVAMGGKAKGGKGMQFVWISSNAMPITRDRIMAESLDWRTNQRLRMYEVYVEQRVAFLQRNSSKFLYPGQLKYMDSFSTTLPLVEAAAGDCGHFSAPNYQKISVSQILALIC